MRPSKTVVVGVVCFLVGGLVQAAVQQSPKPTFSADLVKGKAPSAAATALLKNTKLSAKRIAEESMAIAGKICIYTNDSLTFEELE